MIRPLIEVSKDLSTGSGIELTLTRRWSHFGFWARGRALDIYSGILADEMREIVGAEE